MEGLIRNHMRCLGILEGGGWGGKGYRRQSALNFLSVDEEKLRKAFGTWGPV